jgi:hypothetical protein
VDHGGDLAGVRLHRKMSGVEKADDRLGQVPFERFGARGQEERIIFVLHGKEGRLVEVELHLVRSGAREVEVVGRVTVRRDRCRVRDA